MAGAIAPRSRMFSPQRTRVTQFYLQAFMHPKIKNRPVGEKPAVNAPKPPMVHDVTKQNASANAASRRKQVAMQPASGSANHARHHVSPKGQS